MAVIPIVTLYRPEAKNAVTGGMLAKMDRAWCMLDDPEARS
jgi:enoyl-CoA hydratase/carnithine racemase